MIFESGMHFDFEKAKAQRMGVNFLFSILKSDPCGCLVWET